MSSHASSYAPTPNASAEALDPRATLLKATQALGMHESTAEQRFATVMGPRAREKLVQEAMAAGFRLEGDSDEDFVRRVLDKLAAPAVEAVTDASGAALKEARTALLEAAGSATTINSRVAEAKTKFQGRLDELLALVTSIKAKQKHIDAIDASDYGVAKVKASVPLPQNNGVTTPPGTPTTPQVIVPKPKNE